MSSDISNGMILEFSRFEFKYVLHKQLRKAVESELGYFMHLDPFVEEAEHNRYIVRSLYFDDPFNTAFFDKVDGLKKRSKFRVRTYAREKNAATPIFLEQKGRYDNRVFKHRALLTDSSLDFDDKHLTEMLLTKQSNEPMLEKFRFDWFRKQIRPVALIDYLRRPYISKYDHEFRVTFDEKLVGTETSDLFPRANRTGVQLLPGYTVMEVKFGHKVPGWFHRILQSYELERVPLSKICEVMKRLNLATEL